MLDIICDIICDSCQGLLFYRHCPGLAVSVVPQPDIHLLEFSAVPAILLVQCWISADAVPRSLFRLSLNFVVNSCLGVAIDGAGDEWGLSQYICHWADDRQGNSWSPGCMRCCLDPGRSMVHLVKGSHLRSLSFCIQGLPPYYSHTC
jgi:hypothetical protein